MRVISCKQIEFNQSFLFQKVPCNSIYCKDHRTQGKQQREKRFRVQPFIQLEAAEYSKQDDCKHLECHAAVACVIVKKPLLLIERHLV
jgi:hypothetical protein